MPRRPRSLLTVEEAFTKVMSLASAIIEFEEVELSRAVQRVAALTIHADIPLPPFDRSAVDGFGIVKADICRTPPYSLQLIGRIGAGAGLPSETLLEGQTLRLAT